jgi:RES domain-containing protein
MGASLFGGRWNQKGTSVIYTADSRALCALEVLANADELANDYVATPIETSDQIAVTLISIPDLPREWNLNPPIDTTRQIGVAIPTPPDRPATTASATRLDRQRQSARA